MSRPTQRLLAVLEMLQSERQLTGAEMARRLRVDPRTLRRYVTRLEAMGVPITTERGRAGGYALVSGFRLPPMMFTDDEAIALSVGLRAAGAMGLASAAPAVASAQAKLERVLPPGPRARVRAIGATVALDLGTRGEPGDDAALATLSAAAHGRRRVELHYRDAAGRESRRVFDTYGLAFVSGRWYAVGRCHMRRDLRSFRLDRIASVESIDAAFEPPRGFDSLRHMRESTASIPRAHAIDVLLETDLARARGAIFPAFGLLEPTPGGVRLRGQADDLAWFARELARLPFDFVVRSPERLRSALAAEARRLARLARRSGRPGRPKSG